MNKKLASLVLLLSFSTLLLGACGGGENSTPTATPASPASPAPSPAK